jgi:hypothetical protein
MWITWHEKKCLLHLISVPGLFLIKKKVNSPVKKREIANMAIGAAIGAVAGYVTIDALTFFIALRRKEEKNTGIFRYRSDFPEVLPENIDENLEIQN